MEEFVSALMQPGEWTRTQWLAILIAFLLLLASCYFVWKLVQIIKDAGKSSYTPNIGLDKHRRLRPEGVNAPRRDGGQEGEARDGHKDGGTE